MTEDDDEDEAPDPDDPTVNSFADFVLGLDDEQLVDRVFRQYYTYFAVDPAIHPVQRRFVGRQLEDAEEDLRQGRQKVRARNLLRGFLLQDLLHRGGPA